MNAALEGYKRNAVGHLVPIESIEEIDLARDDLVLELVGAADAMQEQLRDFKRLVLGEVEAFVQLAGERYGAKLGGVKGNLTLMSFDGRYQVKVQVQDRISFDERLQAAKELIDGCIHRWTEGSNPHIRALVEHAFQTDKEGKINTGRVLGLTRLKIDDAEWLKAMEALKDSIQVVSTATYIRFYRRRDDGDGKYEQIQLDLAALREGQK